MESKGPLKNTKSQQTPKSSTLLLTREVTNLTREISKLKNQEFMQVFARPWKFIWFSFLKGLMIGFGSVLGASVLVGLFIYMLAQIRLVPVLGDFVQDVIDQIQIEKNLTPTPIPATTSAAIQSAPESATTLASPANPAATPATSTP